MAYKQPEILLKEYKFIEYNQKYGGKPNLGRFPYAKPREFITYNRGSIIHDFYDYTAKLTDILATISKHGLKIDDCVIDVSHDSLVLIAMHKLQIRDPNFDEYICLYNQSLMEYEKEKKIFPELMKQWEYWRAKKDIQQSNRVKKKAMEILNKQNA